MDKLFTLGALLLSLLGAGVARAEPLSPPPPVSYTPAPAPAERVSLGEPELTCYACRALLFGGGAVFLAAYAPAVLAGAGMGAVLTVVGLIFPPLLVLGPVVAVASAIPVLGAFVALPFFFPGPNWTSGDLASNPVALLDAGLQAGGLLLAGVGGALELGHHLGRRRVAVLPVAGPGRAGVALAAAF